MESTAPERPDLNTGGGDHDSIRSAYVPGHTDLYLCPAERSRLTLLRAGVRAGKFTDDLIAEPIKEN